MGVVLESLGNKLGSTGNKNSLDPLIPNKKNNLVIIQFPRY